MNAYPLSEVVFDDSCFPLIYQVLPPRLDVEAADRYCRRFEQFLLRGEPFVSVADASAVTERGVPMVRKRLADWSRTNEPAFVRLSKGDGRIVKNAVIRGTMTAINWLHRTAVPQEWFTSPEEAIRWAVARLDESRVHVPPSLRMRALARAK